MSHHDSLFDRATVEVQADGRVAFTIKSSAHAGVEVITLLPQDIAVACVCDDIAGPILAATRTLRPFKE